MFLSAKKDEGGFHMLKPLKDRVVIQMVEQEEKTAGGLFQQLLKKNYNLQK